MSSVPWEALRFFPKELNEFKESSVEMKRTKTVIALNMNVWNKCEKSICELVVTTLHRLFHYFFSRHPDITEPRPKSSDAAPWNFYHRFVVSTVTLIPRCNIFVLSNDVIKWFYHRKKIQKPTFRAVLRTVIHFLNAVDKANVFVSVQPLTTNPRQSEEVRSTLSNRQSISRAGCFVRTKSDWPNLTGLGPATTNLYCVRYSRHYSLDILFS